MHMHAQQVRRQVMTGRLAPVLGSAHTLRHADASCWQEQPTNARWLRRAATASLASAFFTARFHMPTWSLSLAVSEAAPLPCSWNRSGSRSMVRRMPAGWSCRPHWSHCNANCMRSTYVVTTRAAGSEKLALQEKRIRPLHYTLLGIENAPCPSALDTPFGHWTRSASTASLG